MSQRKQFDLSGGMYSSAVTLVDSAGNSSTPATGTLTSVTSSATDVTILASNSVRKGVIIDNESTAVLYLLFAVGTSTTTNYSLRIPANGNFILNPGEYTGVIKGVWASANGFARVTEFS